MISKKPSATPIRAATLTCLVLLCAMIFQGCLTRQQVRAYTWLNNSPLPADLCEKNPELQNYGFYRRLKDGKLEFVSFCQPCEPPKACAADFISIYKVDFENVLDKLLPRKKEK